MTAPLVELQGVAKTYGSGDAAVQALRDTDLRVYPGEVVGLLGPSGSGKTTLLNLVGCIVEPTRGRMALDGETVFDGRWLRADLRRLRKWGAAHGKQVIAICYIDVGVYEGYRGDTHRFAKAQRKLRARTGNPHARLWGNKDVGWDDSWWLDVRQRDLLRPIMKHRIKDWCVRKGFDAVEPDETEVWDNNPGFPISKKQNHRYTRMIARMAHRYGLSVGLKGNTGEAKALEPYHDWALAEECFQYDECGKLVRTFVRAGKAVFDVEYARDPDCRYANRNRMNAVRRDLDLVGPHHRGYRYQPCRPDGARTW